MSAITKFLRKDDGQQVLVALVTQSGLMLNYGDGVRGPSASDSELMLPFIIMDIDTSIYGGKMEDWKLVGRRNRHADTLDHVNPSSFGLSFKVIEPRTTPYINGASEAAVLGIIEANGCGCECLEYAEDIEARIEDQVLGIISDNGLDEELEDRVLGILSDNGYERAREFELGDHVIDESMIEDSVVSILYEGGYRPADDFDIFSHADDIVKIVASELDVTDQIESVLADARLTISV